MPTAQLETALQDATLTITQEIRVKAPIEVTFDAVLEQVGPSNTNINGNPMPLKLEAWPGGRWFRDLDDNNGHFWGHVQAIKSPTLLELTGPLFMSAPVANNIQYRLSEEDGETVIHFRHTGFGLFPEGVKENIHTGWSYVAGEIRKRAESSRA
ncbi:MAG: SRPBCC domain-containing protein [Acidobacteria bacterium]|nr:SRPBCC domain-containing protein [Acidobacteriota bacterium]